MVVVVGINSEAKEICKSLILNQYECTVLEPDKLLSVTALVLSDPTVSNIIFLHGVERNWSMGHLLAAAKHLQGRGHLIFFSPDNMPPKMIWSVSDLQELLDVLKKPATSDSGSRRSILSEASLQELRPKRDWTPRSLDVPPEKILFLGISGTQHRIGCTTHAIGVWHYCKKLGFDPAIVASKEAIAEIAAPMKSEQIPDGCRIEGIPFVVNTAQPYDCYIFDFGNRQTAECLQQIDVLLLVAGIKPWEIQHTMTALHATQKVSTPVLLSFASKVDADTLRPMFGDRRTAVAPWTPNLWEPSVKLLGIYEYLLYPMLDWCMKNEDRSETMEKPCPQDYEQEVVDMKGD